MTLGDQIAVYVDVLLKLVDLDHVYSAVDALIARDSASRWWGIEQ